MRLALGTAQWGAGYGITNTRGRLDDDAIAAIMATALALGITAVDTHRTTDPAQGYGSAQRRLRPWSADVEVTTKVFGGDRADLPAIDQLRASLDELGLQRVRGCLVHDWYALDEAARHRVAGELEQARALGLVDEIGISAYDVADAAAALRCFPALGAVQVPASVIDQRFSADGIMVALRHAGTRVQVRSVFLQGLLLDPNSSSPLASHPDVERFHDWCRERAVPPLVACLAHVHALPWADEVVVGVTGADELAQIGEAWATSMPDIDWGALASSDAALLDPRRWER
ncbi:MAG: aldo/keto reductase [Candidatus Nanopelagicales bacterium]|nr:aldo/keto reductase [Candidatus Nanopelagicales bacterium]